MPDKRSYTVEGNFMKKRRSRFNEDGGFLQVSEHSGSVWVVYTYHFNDSTLVLSHGTGGQRADIYARDLTLILDTKSKLETLTELKLTEVEK